jgi:hypothetical protein
MMGKGVAGLKQATSRKNALREFFLGEKKMEEDLSASQKNITEKFHIKYSWKLKKT